MRSWLALICVLAGLAAAGTAIACSCVRYRSAAEQMRDAEVVFVGEVVGTRPMGGGEVGRTTFRVIRTLKGPPSRTQVIRHRLHSDGSCGITFRAGTRAVVLARRSNGELHTSSCSSAQFPETDYVRAAAKR